MKVLSLRLQTACPFAATTSKMLVERAEID